MHLSLDTMSMVDDSCLSPSNFHEMGKGGGITAGGRVHSIDVILGFSKDQEALLSPVPPPHQVDIDSLAEHEKQQEASQEASSHPTYSGHLSSLRNGGVDQQQYHGESVICWYQWSIVIVVSLTHHGRSNVQIHSEMISDPLHYLCGTKKNTKKQRP